MLSIALPLLSVGGAAMAVADNRQPRSPEPAVPADQTWRSSLPGPTPANLRYLGAWNANEYPDYPIHFLNLGLQDAFQFLGPDGTDPALVLDHAALRQAVASAAVGQAVLLRVEHVFFGQNMPYDHLCGDVKPTWQGGCAPVANSTTGPLSHWASRWRALRAALSPFIDNQTVKGVQMVRSHHLYH